MKRGANTHRVPRLELGLQLRRAPAPSVTVNEFTYSLAEGATGAFFDLDVTLANPGRRQRAGPSRFPAGGRRRRSTHTTTVAGDVAAAVADRQRCCRARRCRRSCTRLDAVPLAVERTMIWDARGYGGHGGGAVAPGDALAVRRRLAGLLQHVRPAGERQRGGGRRDGAVPARRRRRGRRIRSPCRRSRGSTIFAGDRRRGSSIVRSASTSRRARRSSPSARCTLAGRRALFEGGHESAGRQRPEHALVPRGRRDGIVLRLLRAAQQSECDARRTSR